MQSLEALITQLTESPNLTLDDQVIGEASLSMFRNIFLEDQLSLLNCTILNSATNSLHLQAVVSRIMGQTAAPGLQNISVQILLLDISQEGEASPNRHALILLEMGDTPFLTFLGHYNQDPASIISLFDGSGELAVMSQLLFQASGMICSTMEIEILNQVTVYPTSFSAIMPKSELRQGLNFRVQATLLPNIIPTEHLPIPTSYSFMGLIGPGDSAYDFNIGVSFQSKFSLSIFSFDLKDIGLTFPLATFGSELPDLMMNGSLSIGNLHIDIRTRFDLVRKILVLEFTGPTISIPSISDLLSPAGIDDPHQFLPPVPTPIAEFFLQELRVEMELAPLYVSKLNVQLTTQQPIQFLEQVIDFTPFLQVSITSPFDSEKRTIESQLSGLWLIQQTTLFVNLSYPEFFLFAELAPGRSLDTKALIQTLIPGVTNFPQLSFQDLELSANFPQKSFDAEIDIATDWEIEMVGERFGLRELSLEVSYAESKVKTLDMNGRITLANIHFGILAAYDFAGGWTFRAATEAEEVIPLTELFVKVRQQFSGREVNKQAIPATFLDIEVRNVFFEYQTASSKFTFYASLAHEIQITPSFSLESFFVRTDIGLEGMSGQAVLKLKILEIEVFLESEKLEGNKGWKFKGNTQTDQVIPVGTLFEELKGMFHLEGRIPDPIQELSASNLHIEFDTESKDFNFGCEGTIPISGKHVNLRLNIDLTRPTSGGYKKDFSGYFTIGPFQDAGLLVFDLHFLESGSGNNISSLFAASYFHKGGPSHINLATLISAISSSNIHVPVDLTVDLKDILLVFDKQSSQPAKFLFALDISAGLNLSNLPLVGKILPKDKSVSLDNLQFVLASEEFKQVEVQGWTGQNLLPAEITPLPDKDLPKGLTIDGQLNLGGLEKQLDLPVSGGADQTNTSTPAQTSSPPTPQNPASTKWFTLQKKIGPIYFERIGVQYDKGALWFLLDASLTVEGLNISMQGLSIGSSLQKFEPQFKLDGLGIDYKKGPLEIGGAFLRYNESEFDGTAIIKTEALSLAAIGSYAELSDGHKSLFLYAVLDYPLGGPPFFFVTGLAAGFGYNRKLNVPAIDQVANFPLVSEAVGGATPIPSGAGARDALMAELTKLREDVPPEVGQYFLAVGLKFNSFKLIDSFALLTISFGNRFELDLLGLSTAVAPTPEEGKVVEPLAEIQMAIKASFVPDEGFLGLEAQLTSNSFILSKKCHLTGGFAFYSWFKGPHKGDFVTSIGGYHPQFKVPAHYPKVPRLGFNWQVTDQLSLKGGAYFALTATALMAGGRLEALWKDEHLSATFVFGADFLVAWKPYHYDARVFVEVAVEYTFDLLGTHHISVDAGANLHIWGPDFSGKAHVKLWIITFDVEFGAAASQRPEAISWASFRSSFLPASDQDLLSISAISGIQTQTPENSPVSWILDPKHIVLETNSIIPIKNCNIVGTATQEFGIAPMDIKSQDLVTSLGIHIKNSAGEDISADFEFEPIVKKMPVALWGTSLSPQLNGQKFVDDVLTGFRIRLKKKEVEPENSPAPIDRSKFLFSPTNLDTYIRPKDLPKFNGSQPENWQNQLNGSMQSNETRTGFLEALGMTQEVSNLSDQYAQSLMTAPQFASEIPTPV